MTDTRAAFGAQTAKYVPSSPSLVAGCEPSFSYARSWVPSLKRWTSSSVSTAPARFGPLLLMGCIMAPWGLGRRG